MYDDYYGAPGDDIYGQNASYPPLQGSSALPPPGQFQLKNGDGSFSPLPQSGKSSSEQASYYQQLLQQGMAPEDAINATKQWAGVPGDASAWNGGGALTQAPVPAATATNSGGSGGGGGGSNGYSATGDGSGLLDPFTQQFNPPPHQNWQDYIPQTPNYTAPTFTPPKYTPPPAWNYQDFQLPDADSVLKTPGYQFRLSEGERALSNAKAAQGIYGTGATLKAILGYGQDYASNEYQNEYNREANTYSTNRQNSLDAYNINYNTQYADPYKNAYQSALDSFAPQMAEFNANVNANNTAYQTQAAAGQRQNENDYANAWNSYLFDYNKFRNRQQDTFGMQFPVVNAD